MRDLTENTPKPLLEVSGRPLLSYVIEKLLKETSGNIYVASGYLKEKLKVYLNELNNERVHYIPQPENIEIAERIRRVMPYISSKELIFCNSDTIYSHDISQQFTELKKSNCGVCVLSGSFPIFLGTFLANSPHNEFLRHRYASRAYDSNGEEIKVNVGMTFINKSFLQRMFEEFDSEFENQFETYIFNKAIKEKTFTFYDCHENWFCCDTPEDLEKASNFFC